MPMLRQPRGPRGRGGGSEWGNMATATRDEGKDIIKYNVETETERERERERERLHGQIAENCWPGGVRGPPPPAAVPAAAAQLVTAYPQLPPPPPPVRRYPCPCPIQSLLQSVCAAAAADKLSTAKGRPWRETNRRLTEQRKVAIWYPVSSFFTFFCPFPLQVCAPTSRRGACVRREGGREGEIT